MPEGGFLASIDNLPPLVFRFQFNPVVLSDKKSYKYDPVAIGNPAFDKYAAASGFFASSAALKDDFHELASTMTNVKPLEAKDGEPRVYTIDFALDGSVGERGESGSRYRGNTIEPDLAVLRSFMYPSMDMVTFVKVIFSAETRRDFHWTEPPDCTLAIGPISVKCKMTDLNIKITEFNEDMSPLRAEVNVVLKEQSKSFHPLIEFITRNISVGQSYVRGGSFTLLQDVSESTIPKFVRDLF